MQKILIATKNSGKFREIKEVLENLPFEFVDLGVLGIVSDFEEGAESYEKNALGKAQFFCKLSGVLTVADDSGIEVDVLPGKLGVQTRRFGGHGVTDEQWMLNFFNQIRHVPEEERGATFVCCIGLSGIVDGLEINRVFRGETRGMLSCDLEAPIIPGIPLSSCFRPDGCDKVYAALSVKDKSRISHRGKAVMALRNFLDGLR